MNDIIQMPKGNYIMKDAVYATTGETRTDRWYPEWIGMTMQLMPIHVGGVAHFRYVLDNTGYLFPGAMHTSTVVSVDISDDEKTVKIETMNTIYTFEKVEEE